MSATSIAWIPLILFAKVRGHRFPVSFGFIWHEECKVDIDKSLTRNCEATYSNTIPDFAHSDFHFATNSVAAAFEADGLAALAKKVLRSTSSHWRYPPGSITIRSASLSHRNS